MIKPSSTIEKKVEYLFDMAGDCIDTCWDAPRIETQFRSIVRSELKELCELYDEYIDDILRERREDMGVILRKHVQAFKQEMEDELS